MPEKQKRFSLSLLLKLAAGLVLFVLSLWGIQWQQLLDVLKAVNMIWLLLALISMAFSLLIKAYRWLLLLRNYGVEVSLRHVSEAYFVGLVVNLLAPARGGDIVRLGMLSAYQPATAGQVAATIALEKFLDLLTLVVISLTVAVYLPPEGTLWLREWLLPISSAALVGLMVVVVFGPGVWQKIEPDFRRFSQSWVQRGISLINNFIESSLWLRDKAHLLPILGLTLLVWFTMWLNNAVLFRGLGMELPVSAGLLVLVLGYVRMLLALPTGSIGPFYFFAQLSVSTFGVDSELALVFAILLHAVVTLTPILVSGGLLLASDEMRRLTQMIWKSNAPETG